MIPKQFDDIQKADLEALLHNQIPEGRMIEYKEDLPGSTDKDKREFLADATSFANASGGDLIYGIREKRDADGKTTGIPESIDGLHVSADAEKRRLEEILRSGVDPKLPGLRLRHLDGFRQGPIILIRIPRSWAAPHMVTFGNLSRFFSRTSAGKQQLDVRELRAIFAASESLVQKIQNFRSDRLAKILAGETPVPLPSGPKVILHLVPFSFADPATNYDLSRYYFNSNQVPPLDSFNLIPRINIDGFLTYSQISQNVPPHTYLQVFRSGAFEAVDAELAVIRNGNKLVAAADFEQEVYRGVNIYLRESKKIGVTLPIVLLVSILGAKGFRLIPSCLHEDRRHFEPIDRDTLLFPEVLVEDYDTTTACLVRPIFDALWQASGLPKSPNFDDNGNWNNPVAPRQRA